MCPQIDRIVVVRQDHASVKDELRTLNNKVDVHKAFESEVTAYREKTIGKKAMKAASKASGKALAKRKYQQFPVWKTSADDLPQSAAKAFLPPGWSIWRANQIGAWMVHLQPFPRHSEQWSRHGNSSYVAMRAAVKHVWLQYLHQEGLDQDQCPVPGLF